MNIKQLTAAIIGGQYDDGLKEIRTALTFRREQLGKSMLYSLQPGDLVRVDNIMPQSICGLVAKVIRVKRTRVSVEFGPDAGKNAGPCTIPAACITEKVEA